MKNVLINAQPMAVVGTGIGRYLRGLSRACEETGKVRLSYFLGDRIESRMPGEHGPGWRECIGRLLWRMPWPVAYGARMVRHRRAEARFAEACTGFDAYHEAGYFPFMAGRSVRTVLTVHDLSLLRFPEWHPRERVAYFRRYFMDRLPLVDGFCAVSEFTRREMIEHLGLPPDRIHVTPPGFDAALFNTKDDGEAQQFLDKAGVPDRYILFVGSGDPRKNLDALMAALAASGRNIPLVVAGWSGWRKSAPSGVMNQGYVSDRALAQLYRRAQLLVMPSEYEGFGLPVLEAMACGCPVITSKAGALLETGGDAVATVEDVTDAPAFGATIGCLLDDTEGRAALRKRSLDRAATFSWTQTAERVLDLWGGHHTQSIPTKKQPRTY